MAVLAMYVLIVTYLILPLSTIIQRSLLYPNTAASQIYPRVFSQYTYPKVLGRPIPSPRKPFSLLPSSPDTWSSYLPIPPSLPISPYLFGVRHYCRTSSPSHVSRTVSNPSGTSSQTSIPLLRSLQYATD